MLNYCPTYFDYEFCPASPDSYGMPMLINHADTDTSTARSVKIDGKKYLHVGAYSAGDFDQRRAIMACLASR